jgi:hypothetical protein
MPFERRTDGGACVPVAMTMRLMISIQVCGGTIIIHQSLGRSNPPQRAALLQHAVCCPRAVGCRMALRFTAFRRISAVSTCAPVFPTNHCMDKASQ